MNLGLTLIITTLADGHMLGLPAMFGAAAHLAFDSTLSRCAAAGWLAVYLKPLILA